MGKLNKNEQGFGAVEGILVLVIVALIGVVGWYVVKNHNKTTPTATTTTTPVASTTPTTTTPATVEPYAEWKTYTLKHEKLSFKYPKDWTLKDTSYSSRDDVKILANEGMRLFIAAGAVPANDLEGGYNTVTTKGMTFLGTSATLTFWTWGNKGDTNIAIINLTKKDGKIYSSKNVTIPPNSQSSVGNINISIDFGENISDTQPSTQQLSKILSSETYKNLVKVLESAQY